MAAAEASLGSVIAASEWVRNSDEAVADGVWVLARFGRIDAAADLLLRAAQAFAPYGKFEEMTTRSWGSIAVAYAEEGEMAAAWKAVEREWQCGGFRWGWYCPKPRGWYAELVMLAPDAVLDGSEAEEAIRAEADDHPSSAAEGFAALAGRVAVRDPVRARRLVGLVHQINTRAVRRKLDARRDPILAETAVALTALGDVDGAVRSVMAVASPLTRTVAASVVGKAMAASDPADARALLTTAARGLSMPYVLAEALARIGAVREAVSVVEREQPDGHPWSALLNGRRLRWIVDAMSKHDPEAALSIARTVGEPLLADHPVPALQLAGQLTVGGLHDPNHVRGLIADIARKRSADRAVEDACEQLLIDLLKSHPDPRPGLRRLQQNRVLTQGTSFGSVHAPGTIAVATAALGHYSEAEAIVSGIGNPAERVDALVELGCYLLRVEPSPIARSTAHRSCDLLELVRALFAVTSPPNGDGAAASARRIIATLLRSDDWYRALPALAAVDPDTARQTADVIIAGLVE